MANLGDRKYINVPNLDYIMKGNSANGFGEYSTDYVVTSTGQKIPVLNTVGNTGYNINTNPNTFFASTTQTTQLPSVFNQNTTTTTTPSYTSTLDSIKIPTSIKPTAYHLGGVNLVQFDGQLPADIQKQFENNGWTVKFDEATGRTFAVRNDSWLQQHGAELGLGLNAIGTIGNLVVGFEALKTMRKQRSLMDEQLREMKEEYARKQKTRSSVAKAYFK